MALPNKAKIPVGHVLSGKYRITREIGRGGMAAVYEAENIDIGKRVAIKVLAQELTASTIVVERFLREARAAAAIRSPYICDVYDSGRLEDGRPFLVLELLEGESLYERMTKIRTLDVDTTTAVITQVCRGLTKAHAASIVHRDLKPENIFLTKDEEGAVLAKILDFGLAKFYAPVEGPNQKQVRLTREGAVFGTPAYMSPEQVRGQGAVDHRADLWALACITYECLTGRTVWATEQGVAMTFAQIANAPIPSPQKFRPDLPPAFDAWFKKALDRNIDKRFQSAKDFAEGLAAAFEQGMPSFSAIHDLESIQEMLDGALADPQTETTTRQMQAPGAAPSPPKVELNVHRALRQPAPSPPVAQPAPTPDEVPISLSDPSVPGAPIPTAPAPPPHAAAAPFAPEAAPSARGSKVAFVAPGRADPAVPEAPRSAPAEGRTSAVAGRVILVAGVVMLLVTAIYAGYKQFLRPTSAALSTSSATPAPTASSDGPSPTTASSPRSSSTSQPQLPWRPLVSSAQQAIASDNYKGAVDMLNEAFEKGGHTVPRTMRDHVQLAAAVATTNPRCRMTGLARPRTYDLASATAKPVASGPPAIALGPRGAVVTWTDTHDGNGHAYAVALDEALRDVGDPVDVTPEGSAIGRPELLSVGEKFVLSYWDAKGAEAGVQARWLDAEGRIAGPAVKVAASKGGNLWPSLGRAADGSFVVAWANDSDADTEDLFLRKLTSTLEPEGDAVRVTDLAGTGPKPRARFPSLAVYDDAIHVAFRLDHEPLHVIQHLRVPLAEAVKGLQSGKAKSPSERNLGESVLVNSDRTKADSPSLACGGSSCFVVWHGDQNGGALAAVIDPDKAKPNWWKKFSKTGARPAVAVSPTGQAQIVWFDGGNLVTASIDRDEVGPASKIARVTGDQPPPSIAAGAKPGEWYVAWLHYEGGHLEPYAARIACH